MSIWHVTGGRRLRGGVRVQGSKNAVLPIIAAALLSPNETELTNCPRLSDVDAAADILRHLGCRTARCGDILSIDTSRPDRCDIPSELMHRMRSSVIFLGPMLARFGEAHVSVPGGKTSRCRDRLFSAQRGRNGKRHDRRVRRRGQYGHL